MLSAIVRRLPAALVTILVLPIIAADYFSRNTGREYGISRLARLVLLLRMVRNNFRVTSASSFVYHILMAARIMNVPKSSPGVLVECGCFKGGSTVNLSLVAAKCGRQLHVFDSFAGLPTPDARDEGHVVLAEGSRATYQQGAYAGTLDEVRSNLSRFGNASACKLHPGYFEDTLPEFGQEVVFAYLDVDLVRSELTCLKYLWPKLTEGSYLYTDEAHHLEIAGLYYDREWWLKEIGVPPPGLVGGGSGLGLFLGKGGFGSSLGYTAKIAPESLPRRPG